MKVDLYIYKTQREFAEEAGSRYIVQAHRFGTPQYKYECADSLVELHYKMQSLPAFNWEEIETSLDRIGGCQVVLDLGEFEFAQLFGRR